MNKVIILDVTYGGYGVVKSLFRFVPIIGFYNANEISSPETKTSLCDTVCYHSEKHLLSKLREIVKKENDKPVLILTSDVQVKFFNKNREFFEENFLVNEPDKETIDSLLYKHSLHNFANEHGFLIPKSTYLHKIEDVKQLNYPVFVKPAFKWTNVFKGFECNNDNEVKELFKYSDALVAQELIPGPTTNIYTEYVYINKNKNWQYSITAKKIREWPTFGGTGSCLELTSDYLITDLAYKFFKTCNYKGFGSLEVKLHAKTNEFYIIEPTVGRVDENSEFAVINGINMPLIHYSNLTEIPFPKNKMISLYSKPKYWISELLDFQSSKEIIKKDPKELFKILKTYWNGYFHLFNIRDIKPFWSFFKDKILKIRPNTCILGKSRHK